MGAGLYMVWPAFYTDVTDACRLARRDRLRVDLGGLYFNAIVAVATVGAWCVWRVDALLLLVALQLIQMVKQLSPVIRADGYHILSDLTGVPDLYAHIGPTLRRLLPWSSNEPSALKGRARLIVTLWVLIVVPALLALALGAILLLPRLLATAWASGSKIAAGIPEAAAEGRILDVLTAAVQLLGLALPMLGADRAYLQPRARRMALGQDVEQRPACAPGALRSRGSRALHRRVGHVAGGPVPADPADCRRDAGLPCERSGLAADSGPAQRGRCPPAARAGDAPRHGDDPGGKRRVRSSPRSS